MNITAPPAATLRDLAMNLARQHASAGVFLVGETEILSQVNPSGDGGKFDRWAAVNAYRTVVANRLFPLGEQERADMDCWYREEKWDF